MTDGHKVENCGGRWIDIGTLQNPWLQKCSGCRGTRQKPADDGEIVDVKALSAIEERHMQGMARLREDLEREASVDPVHQDEHGFWFWDIDMQVRYGPYPDRELAEQAYHLWLDEAITRGSGSKAWGWIVVSIALVIAAIVAYAVST